jgi:hypothetical protein
MVEIIMKSVKKLMPSIFTILFLGINTTLVSMQPQVRSAAQKSSIYLVQKADMADSDLAGLVTVLKNLGLLAFDAFGSDDNRLMSIIRMLAQHGAFHGVSLLNRKLEGDFNGACEFAAQLHAKAIRVYGPLNPEVIKHVSQH